LIRMTGEQPLRLARSGGAVHLEARGDERFAKRGEDLKVLLDEKRAAAAERRRRRRHHLNGFHVTVPKGNGRAAARRTPSRPRQSRTQRPFGTALARPAIGGWRRIV